MSDRDIVQELVRVSQQAREHVAEAVAAVTEADRAVEEALRGKRIRVLHGRATGKIEGGTVHKAEANLQDMEGQVLSVFFYYNSSYKLREDIIRIINDDGETWQLKVTSLRACLVEE